jgi:hypothetical protein
VVAAAIARQTAREPVARAVLDRPGINGSSIGKTLGFS